MIQAVHNNPLQITITGDSRIEIEIAYSLILTMLKTLNEADIPVAPQ